MGYQEDDPEYRHVFSTREIPWDRQHTDTLRNTTNGICDVQDDQCAEILHGVLKWSGEVMRKPNKAS
jgi:hypothetical protein